MTVGTAAYAAPEAKLKGEADRRRAAHMRWPAPRSTCMAGIPPYDMRQSMVVSQQLMSTPTPAAISA